MNNLTVRTMGGGKLRWRGSVRSQLVSNSGRYRIRVVELFDYGATVQVDVDDDPELGGMSFPRRALLATFRPTTMRGRILYDWLAACEAAWQLR